MMNGFLHFPIVGVHHFIVVEPAGQKPNTLNPDWVK